MPTSTWKTLGLGLPRPLGHRYERCDSEALKAGAPRTHFNWEPTHCSLKDFDRAAACAALRGRVVHIVGDSLSAQLFLSMTMILGGKLGKNIKRDVYAI